MVPFVSCAARRMRRAWSSVTRTFKRSVRMFVFGAIAGIVTPVRTLYDIINGFVNNVFLRVMKSIAFLSQKGGSGKTTLAVHTAVAAQESGERVVLIDTDPQKLATVWGETRQSDSPIVATAAASDLEKVLQAGVASGNGKNSTLRLGGSRNPPVERWNGDAEVQCYVSRRHAVG
jgi:Mrp family chromosome partitioning ATPase